MRWPSDENFRAARLIVRAARRVLRAGFPVRHVAAAATLCMAVGVAAQEATGSPSAQGVVPDLRDEPPPVSTGRGNFVGVPIPFSNPTLDAGLVLGAAWFHGQSEEQKAVQPPSVTGGGLMYSKGGGYAFAAGHAAYWDEDRWRFTGAVGYADLDLPLSAGGEGAVSNTIDWLLSGSLAYATVSRLLAGHWYVGVTGRWIDLEQSFSSALVASDIAVGEQVNSRSFGLKLTYDSRDMPSNAYEGRFFELSTSRSLDGTAANESYTSWDAAYRAYHRVRPRLVLAWEAAACQRSEGVALWDACQLGLRGPAATDYLARRSWRAQAEARWSLSERWGVVAFAGGGRVSDSLALRRQGETIPSFGVGLRFTVQKANRINMRLDFAQSNGQEALILSVREAF